MKKHIFLLLFLVICKFSFTQLLVEQVKPSANFYDIPFSKYKLDNGLTIILHQDTSVSTVYVNMLYKVGSAHEIEGKRGYAHLFEHLMFSGTKNLSRKELWNLFPQTASTIINAATTYEYTMYEELVPANYLERALWLESQRLQYTPEFINEENVAIQKEIVLNEITMRMEDDCAGILDKEIHHYLYSKDHPLHYTTGGNKTDIEQATLVDVRDFFLKWYAPNNAILSVSGNFEINETLSLINNYFGSIKSSPVTAALPIVNEQPLPETKISNIQYDIDIPIYALTFPTVKRWHEDEAALDALSYLLSQKDNPKRLADEFLANLYQKAILIYMDHPCTSFSGQFEIRFKTEKVIDRPEQLVLNTFKTVKKRKFLEENTEEYKEYFKTKIYDRFSTIRETAHQLLSYERLLGTPNGLPEEWRRNMNLTETQLVNAFNNYLYNKPFVAVNIIPYTEKQKKSNRKIMNTAVKKNMAEDFWNIEFAGDSASHTTHNALVPSPTPERSGDFSCWKKMLNNEIEVAGVKTNSPSPLSTLKINFKAGLIYNKPEYAGLTGLYVSVLNNIINSGAAQNNLKRYGAQISLIVNDDDLAMYLQFNENYMEEVISTVEQLLFNSQLSPIVYMDYIRFYNSIMKNQFKETSFLTTKAMLRKSFYPKKSLFSYTPYGSENTIYYLSNVYNFSQEIAELLNTKVSIYYSGNLEQEEVIYNLDVLKNWKTDPTKKIMQKPVSLSIPSNNILIHNKTGAVQSDIQIGLKTIITDSLEQKLALQLINNILGETFSSRLNTKLREQKGLAYFCKSELSNSTYDDVLYISTKINLEKTDMAIEVLIKELNNFIENGVTENELQVAKNNLMYKVMEIPDSDYERLLKMETFTTTGKVNKLENDRAKKIIGSFDVEHLNKFIRNIFKPNTYQIAIVTDKSRLEEKLKNLNIQVTDYSKDLY